jgi:hypothetical protein
MFFAYNFLKGTLHLHHISNIKSQKEVTKQQESRFFLLFLLDDRRIRIRSWIKIRIPMRIRIGSTVKKQSYEDR